MQVQELKERVRLAANWLAGPAQVKAESDVTEKDRRRHVHQTWKGAFRGEYNGATREWGFFCPVWHGGQAVKALVMAEELLGDAAFLDSAAAAADFILANSVMAGDGRRLIFAYEDHADKVNVSAILECLDGLLFLAERIGRLFYRDAAIEAARWIKENSYIDRSGLFNTIYALAKDPASGSSGLFKDLYNPAEGSFVEGAYGMVGRPLLDDAIFVKAWRISGDESFLQAAKETGDRLLLDEGPPGNWVQHPPCKKETGSIHPRHAYWWGNPMRELYHATKDKRYLDAFVRSVEWYRKAMRRDGGIFRGTYVDFNTDSFGHAVSGSGCAVVSFVDYLEETGDSAIVPYIERGLDFCMSMQMLDPDDERLRGAVMEKVVGPGGTDRSPYRLRDLGTIFFIQAACRWMKSAKFQ